LGPGFGGDLEKEFGNVEIDGGFGERGSSFHLQLGPCSEREKTGEIDVSGFSIGQGLNGNPTDEGGWVGLKRWGKNREKEPSSPSRSRKPIG